MFEYRNPFANYDTNTMSAEQVSFFFTEPYNSLTIPKKRIIEDSSPIVFEGGRGTGKTMLLRRFSYNVQRINGDGKRFIDIIKQNGFLGIYFRVDSPLLQNLSSLGASIPTPGFEESIFSHFFELSIFKDYLEIIKIIEDEEERINGVTKSVDILSELLSLISFIDGRQITCLEELLHSVIGEINYIWEYQSKKAIDIDGTEEFRPNCNLVMQGMLSDEFCKTRILELLGIKGISILLMIDEYESFSANQQKVINAAMRFKKDYGVKLRIGMRPYGFKTFATINAEEFIKEGRDYSKFVFSNPLLKKNKKNYFMSLAMDIARKRIESVPFFSSISSEIVEYLGKEEKLEEEAREIVKGQKKHFDVYINEIKKRHSSFESINESSLSLFYNDNPLLEMECLLLLLRGKSIDYVKKALSDYLDKRNSEEAKKFRNDYENKYKLSFVFILCSIYKKEKKKYYSYTDYCYLSSGIIGSFIELCRRAFDLAFFKEPENLKKGVISPEIQTEAAYEYASAEKEMITRIADRGRELSVFINNLCATFSQICKDIYIKYPETNMIPVDYNLNKENTELLQLACKWSLVQKKPNGFTSSSDSKKYDVYMISRVFAPIYKFSYRTRGGFNPIKNLTDDFFSPDFIPESAIRWKDNNLDGKQPLLFDC